MAGGTIAFFYGTNKTLHYWSRYQAPLIEQRQQEEEFERRVQQASKEALKELENK
eukprot:CAMPEP_0175815762 /NCGR_PEP_ID=MMETSP0107_2-20121207/6140_1 /TAXON_ID=195067 ORGANISM="Goniomonas pacifica, Strain CCMP1869" /NCGR_SAMPLE_ID=MMETSP0107_2 /ASSEMBLY_ACC=CAM_ASM_000203 /LENGTH=54 /DNA_ID=CAMNT_0017127827 /DNA_START=45 /DNA_END=209 /DNA_ORIENTATION=-